MKKITEILPAAQKELNKSPQASLTKSNKPNVELLRKNFPTGKDFLISCNFDSCTQKFKQKTAREALQSGAEKLTEISQAFNERTPIFLIEVWLINLCLYLGFEITKGQARETAYYIFEEVPFLNLVELTLVFKRIKKGYYGLFYGKFDGLKIIQAFIAYRQERGKELSQLSSKDQQKLIQQYNSS